MYKSTIWKPDQKTILWTLEAIEELSEQLKARGQAEKIKTEIQKHQIETIEQINCMKIQELAHRLSYT